jgi:hypothetical protein
MDTVEVVEMIKTTLTRRGEGVDGDPIRVITQYWDFKGNLLFEIDTCPPNGACTITSSNINLIK